jgi:hypothetical protein
LLARVSSRELTEWEAYEAVTGPIGDERFDHLFAMLASVVANVNRDRKQRPYPAEQFLPKWQAKQETGNGETDPEQLLRTVKRLHKAMGGG